MGVLGHEYWISPDELREIFEYDSETGDLRWKRIYNKYMKRGKVAGSFNSFGIMVGVSGRVIPARRIIWAMHNDEWPEGNIKHKDKDKYNNRIENLYVGSVRKSDGAKRKPKARYSYFKEIPITEIQEYFYLDSSNRPRWKKKAGPKAIVGELAGVAYCQEHFIGFRKLLIPAQKIAYALLNGSWPEIST